MKKLYEEMESQIKVEKSKLIAQVNTIVSNVALKTRDQPRNIQG